MKNYKVVFEIEISATSPLKAAKQIQSWLKQEDNWQWYVQDEGTGKVFSVDLQEGDEDAVIQVDDYKPLIQHKNVTKSH